VSHLALIICVGIVFFGGICQAEIFFLRDGSCIAGTSPKPLDDHFIRLQTLQGTVDIERSEILLHRSDMELNRLCKKMRADLTPGSSSELTQLAWWCRTKGLYDEMFEFLDKALSIDPQTEAAQKFIAEMVDSIDYKAFRALPHLGGPDPQLDLFRASASSGRTLARIGEGILSRLPEEMVTSMLLRHILSGKEGDRFFALRVCRTLKPKKALEVLVKTALFDRCDEARSLALDALCEYDDKNIVNPFVSALKLDFNRYRLNALDGLERLQDRRVSGVLIAGLAPANSAASDGVRDGTRAHVFVGNQRAAVTGFDTQIAASAAIASPVISTLQDGVVLDVKIYGVAIYSFTKAERKRIGGVLADLNSVDYGTDVGLWKTWWDKNKKEILAAEKD